MDRTGKTEPPVSQDSKESTRRSKRPWRTLTDDRETVHLVHIIEVTPDVGPTQPHGDITDRKGRRFSLAGGRAGRRVAG